MAYWNINDKKMVWDRLFLSSWLVAGKEVGFGNPSFSSDMNLGLFFCCGFDGLKWCPTERI